MTKPEVATSSNRNCYRRTKNNVQVVRATATGTGLAVTRPCVFLADRSQTDAEGSAEQRCNDFLASYTKSAMERSLCI